MKYNVYRSATETFVRMYWKIHQTPKHRRTPGSALNVIAMLLQDREGAIDNMTRITLIDEDIARHYGSVVYFPESSNLAAMLWRANMREIAHHTFKDFTRGFTIAWPQGTVVDGVELQGCMISIGGTPERVQDIKRTLDRYGDDATLPITAQQPAYHCAFAQGGREFGDDQWLRTSIPQDKLDLALQDTLTFHESLGDYGDGFGLTTTPEERHRQYVHLRMAIRLMVYCEALPKSVQDGFPGGVGRHEMGTGVFTHWTPRKVQEPAGSRHHDSPASHWRTWHFRQYPVKKDGSRTPGLVFVNDCVVGADVTPKTVKEVEHAVSPQ